MRKLVIAISSVLVFAQLFIPHPAVTQGGMEETRYRRETKEPAPRKLMESVLFDTALGYCRDGQYKEAIVDFEFFLLCYPQSGLADDAQFWIGECYRAQHELEEAIAAYQRVIDGFPGGNRVPTAMLHQGFAYLKMDDRIDAKLVLGKLADELPMAKEAEIARTVLERMADRETGRITHLSPDMAEWRIFKATRHEEGEWITVKEERSVDEEIASRDRVVEGYQMKIARAIRSNWSFPFFLFNVKKHEIPEAVVLLTIRNDGTIIGVSFKERSRNELFDESIANAIEKSDPLPQFPSGYGKIYDEAEIRFSLKGAVFK
jgi:tol-pal system protein YbgF